METTYFFPSCSPQPPPFIGNGKWPHWPRLLSGERCFLARNNARTPSSFHLSTAAIGGFVSQSCWCGWSLCPSLPLCLCAANRCFLGNLGHAVDPPSWDIFVLLVDEGRHCPSRTFLRIPIPVAVLCHLHSRLALFQQTKSSHGTTGVVHTGKPKGMNLQGAPEP